MLHLLEKRRLDYANRWSITSDIHEKQDDYKNLVSDIAVINPLRIIDIGSGNGNGISVIINTCNPTTLVSIEENPLLIEACVKRFKGTKNINITRRMESILIGKKEKIENQTYDVRFIKSIKDINGLHFVETDIGLDNYLPNMMSKHKKFDAVTVWLMGGVFWKNICVHSFDKTILLNHISLRENTQKCSFTLASKVLRSNGILNFIDRRFCRDEQELDDVKYSLLRQFDIWNKELDYPFLPYCEITTHLFSPPLDASGYIVGDDIPNLAPEDFLKKWHFISVVLYKS